MKRNLNSKVIATGLFNVANQNNDLDNVRVALKTLNHIVLDSGQFRALVQSKKIKGKSKVEILNSVLGKLSHPLSFLHHPQPEILFLLLFFQQKFLPLT